MNRLVIPKGIPSSPSWVLLHEDGRQRCEPEPWALGHNACAGIGCSGLTHSHGSTDFQKLLKGSHFVPVKDLELREESGLWE